eukprot:scaffold87888_cov57-Phaeocystis_antarctica.AAC.1
MPTATPPPSAGQPPYESSGSACIPPLPSVRPHATSTGPRNDSSATKSCTLLLADWPVERSNTSWTAAREADSLACTARPASSISTLFQGDVTAQVLLQLLAMHSASTTRKGPPKVARRAGTALTNTWRGDNAREGRTLPAPMASGFAIRRDQIAAINRMLDLNREIDERGAWHDPWKILVYDAFCRDVISPLLKKGDLRKRGITLHLLLDSARDQIADVPAIYFVQPTKANVDRLGADCAAGLYEAYYLNFTPAVPRVLLEDLAAKALASENVGQIGKVMDQYLNFSSLEDDLFSLLVPESFVRLNGVTDSVVEAAVEQAGTNPNPNPNPSPNPSPSPNPHPSPNPEQVVSGLFSTLVTLGVVPVLRYPRGGAAQMVAELLGRRLHDQLKELLGRLHDQLQGSPLATCHLPLATCHSPATHLLLTCYHSATTTHLLRRTCYQAHSGLFSEAQSGAGFQRPLLVIMERSADL